MTAVSVDQYKALTTAAIALASPPMRSTWTVDDVRPRAEVTALVKAGQMPGADDMLGAWQSLRYRLRELDVTYNPFPIRNSLLRPTDGRAVTPITQLARNPLAIRLLLLMHTRRTALKSTPDHEWARMLGLDSGPSAARRISTARRALVDARLLHQGSGHHLLDEGDPAREWTPPTLGVQISRTPEWFRLPWWVINNGWLCVLDQKAVATLLVLLSASGGRDGEESAPKFHSQAVLSYATVELGELTRERIFDISDDVFLPGARTLIDWGLLSREVQPDPANPVTAKKSFYRLSARMIQRTPLHLPAPAAVKPTGSYVDNLYDVDSWL